MSDYILVKLVNFPNYSATEVVTPNEDRGYTVLLNANITHEARQKAYLHALSHILNHDFEKQDVQNIEAETHLL